MARRSPLGLKIIGAIKLVSAVLLTALGLGIFHLVHLDIAHTMEIFIRQLHLDPEKYYIHKAISRITGIKVRKLHSIGVATFIYAALYTVEGVGLLKARRWAEYLTVIITASLIPFELFELFDHPNMIKAVVFLINMLIVVYLVYQLKKTR